VKLTLFVIFTFVACVAPSTNAERDIRSRYDEIERAYAARDVDTVLASLDRGLEVIGPDGEHEDYARRAELIRQWFARNEPPIDFRITIEAMDVRADGEVAVRVLERVSRYQARDGGRPAHVVHEVRQRETWIRTAAGWKRKRIDEIDYENRKVWVDGVAVPLEKQSPPPVVTASAVATRDARAGRGRSPSDRGAAGLRGTSPQEGRRPRFRGAAQMQPDLHMRASVLRCAISDPHRCSWRNISFASVPFGLSAWAFWYAAIASARFPRAA
jgi:hypothetical protein